jgi:hypothetical protein
MADSRSRGLTGARSGEPAGPSAAGPTPEETLVSQAAITLTFTATCDADKNPSWLQKNLPQELAKAVIYPDRIGAIKADDKGHVAITVGEVRLSTSSVAGSAASGAMVVPAAESKESAIITIGLVAPKEADKLLADLAEKRAKEAEEKATAAAAKPAESAPPAQTPPSPDRKP